MYSVFLDLDATKLFQNNYLFDITLDIPNMKYTKLHHYRCFENLELTYSNKINLFIGDNSSGKTTIIRALSTVLNTFFTGFSDENTRFVGLRIEDIRMVKAGEGLANIKPIKIEFDWYGKSASLELHSIKGKTLQNPLKSIKEWGAFLNKNLFEDGKQVHPLPLIASFSTSDIHKPRRLNSYIFKKYLHKPSFGYFECLQGDGFLHYWTWRLLALREGNKGEMEIEGVLNAIQDALGPAGCDIIAKVDIRPIQKEVYYTFPDGRETTTENLSDGYRRLVNIVMDIAFRCMLLNKGIYGGEACKKTTGTVLIDEVDLHLHPKLQSVVMKGLQNAFPEVQFIITSHAPMIMTGIPMDEENKIVKLDFNPQMGYTAKEVKAYGLDASKIIEAILGVAPRSAEVENRLIALFDYINNDEYALAAEKFAEMKEQFGDYLPELSRAEAMLNFIYDAEDDTN